MRRLDEIIIHTAVTRPSWMADRPLSEKVAEIRRWHVEGNGWSDIGYHFVIDRDGRVMAGRPVERIGAHTYGHNDTTIGICLLGGYGGNADDPFREHYTSEQDVSLRSLIADLQGRYGIRKVSGHNEYAAKACPCFHVPSWFTEGDGPPVDRPLLRVGSKGRFVLDLQEALHALSYAPGPRDGHFGRLTRDAVLEFQADQGLATDGIVGRRTWAALEEAQDPRPERYVTAQDLRERGSRTVKAADRTQAAAAGAGVTGVTAALTAAQADLEGVAATGLLGEAMPYVLTALGIMVVGFSIYAFVQGARARAARLDDARTARNPDK